MRIFVENSGYALRNVGDVAMLQVALERLRGFWPEASLEVLTLSPERLERFCPGAHPLPAGGEGDWAYVSTVPRQLGRLATPVAQQVSDSVPGIGKWVGRTRMRLRRRDPGDLNAYLEALENADLVVATGGGYVTDVFEEHAERVLRKLKLAVRCGKCTAMLGHGLGPLDTSALQGLAAVTLPSLDLISLREARVAQPMLRALGVAADRVIVTGDDAIEPAYAARRPEQGTGIGINLRIASYSEVDAELAAAVRRSVLRAAEEHEAALVPVPISTFEEDSDARAIRELVAGSNVAGGISFDLQTPLEVIRQVGLCRVVVTGSYHAGVFALAQGIPVVGLARSAYYRDKFLGLAEQFGTGCWIVLLDHDRAETEIVTAVQSAWLASNELRSPLLAAAKRQIDAGRAAYQRLYELVEARERARTRRRTRVQSCHSTSRG